MSLLKSFTKFICYNNRYLFAIQRCYSNYTNVYSPQKQSAPTLYFDDASPPVRFVLMTAQYIGVTLNLNKVDLFKQENRTDFYKKISPLMKVPALSVNNHIIRDSHAIATYLCERYGDQQLYPSNPLERSKVNEMLFFNNGTLFTIDSNVFCEYFAGKSIIDKKHIEAWQLAMKYVETRLGNHKWLSGDKMTLSDLCCVSTISSLELLIPLVQEYPSVRDWMSRMKEQSFYELNMRGLERLRSFMELVSKN